MRHPRGPASIEAIVAIGLLVGVAPGESLSDSPLRLHAILLNDFYIYLLFTNLL